MDAYLPAIILSDYIDSFVFEPLTTWGLEEIEDRSIERWALYELLELLVINSYMSAKDTIEGYMNSLDDFLEIATPRSRYIYIIALDATKEFLNYFLEVNREFYERKGYKID